MKKKIMKRIFLYVRPNISLLIFALLSASVSVLIALYVPILIGKGVDKIIGEGEVNFNGLTSVLIVLGVAVVLSASFQWLMNLFTNRITFNTIMKMRTQAFERLQKLPLGYIDIHPHGDIISRITTDAEQVSDGLLQGFAQLFTGVLTILGTIFFMMRINVSIALIVVLLTPLSLVAAAVLARSTYKKFSEQSKIRGEITSLSEEMITNHTAVRLFGYGEKSQERFEEINSRLQKVGVLAQFYSSLTNPGTRFINAIVYASVGVFGAVSVINGHFSVGMLTGFLAYASQYTKPFNEISGVITELQNAVASAGRLFELIDEEEEISDAGLDDDNSVCDGEVKINNVSFSYDKTKKLIEGLNLSVNSGQHVAIVGPTGCGKTTIINLLMRFYDVDSGDIIVGGIDIRGMKRKTLRSMYGMVLQETWLFAGTIRENIAYGNPSATKEEIEAAARASYAHSFIKRLPDGYDTVVSEDDSGISQGEKQLLCIARIMLTLPPMLILDEATSSIDTRTEMKIQQAFSKMTEGRTSFIVAHRLSTIKNADIILAMENGRIVEQGTHSSLLDKGGFYASLYNSQFAGNV